MREADYLREQARECRTTAQRRPDGKERAAFLQLAGYYEAGYYEKEANRLEARAVEAMRYRL